jgi:uncharacterized OsmC-like protein
MEAFQVVVRAGEGGLLQQITARQHKLRADEPVVVGGTDLGPTPYDLLLSALGACTSMTVRMYAARKGWHVASVEVRLRHDRIHAQDCAECETKEGRLDRIQLELAITGALDAGQRQKLLEIAQKCPVHRTLKSEMLIDTHLAGAAP